MRALARHNDQELPKGFKSVAIVLVNFTFVYPMAAMVLLTFIVALMGLLSRVRAVRAKQISANYFKTFTQLSVGQRVPDAVLKSTRHYSNLFELPTLYYVALMIGIVFPLKDSAALALAWMFVILRVLHAFIHLGNNNIRWRLLTFASAWMVIISLWIDILLRVSGLN